MDTFDDLVASKMTALVERGAPRDFRDIYTLYERGLCDVDRYCILWQERQIKSGEEADMRRALLAIRTHLARIEQTRPVAGISDAMQRSAAERLRTWFIEEFLHDIFD